MRMICTSVVTLLGVLVMMGGTACSSSDGGDDGTKQASSSKKPDAGGSVAEPGATKSSDKGGADGGASSKADGGSGGSCYRESPPDFTSFPTCCAAEMGIARCAPSDQLPSGSTSALEKKECAQGNLCVPEQLLKSGGKTPASCVSIGDAPGVCVSVCVPMVGMNKAILPVATCAPDERCAPCINPLTKANSGACDIGTAGACK